MRRLSGEDAGFLSLESPIQPMNAMVLAVLRPPNGAGEPDLVAAPLDLEYLRRHMARRLDELPALRWRVERVPYGIHHPVFIEDPDFDLDYHLRQCSLPAPGDGEQLDRLYAALAERRLDRRHPLWQITLVNGLEGGRQAVVLRIHHCLMDGFAVLTTLSRVFTGDDHDPTGAAARWQPEAVPRPARLVVDALADQARAARRLPALIKKTKRNLAAAKAQQSTSIAVPRTGVDAPSSALNRAFTAERRFARTSLPVADLLLVKNVAGVSVNDVALAMVAGSVRAYLAARGELPAKPLVASIPVGLEAPGAAPRTFGNRFSALATSLATDVADPWQRLKVISAVTAESKRLLALAGNDLLPEWLEYVPPSVAERVVRRAQRKRREHAGKVDVNIVISNLRGPKARYSLGEATVEEMYLTGPPNNGVGANVVLWDYGDQMLFAILTFADSVEQPGELARGLHTALDELIRCCVDNKTVGSA